MTRDTPGTAWMIVPPSRERFDGIRDFAAHLASALRPALETETVTTREDAAGAEPVRVIESWRDLPAPAPRAIFVNYTPQAWLRFDTRALLERMRSARAAGTRVVLIVHEYQLDPRPSVKRKAARLVFDGMARRFARASSAIVTTHGFVADWVRRDGLDAYAPIVTIPVGSNLPEPELARSRDTAAREVVMFGQPAGMDAAMVRACAPVAASAGRAITWMCRSEEEATAWMGAAGIEAGAIGIQANLPPARVSALLHAAAIGLAPIVDGVSTRRTTVAAFLQHGLPVVGSDGRATDDLYRRHPGFALAPAGDAGALARALASVLADEKRRAQMSLAARALFDIELSWPRIAARYLALVA